MYIRITIFTLIFWLFFPINRFLKFEPILIWKLNKNNTSDYKHDKYYFNRIGNLQKLCFAKNNKLFFFNKNGSIIKSYNLPSNSLISYGTGKIGAIIYKKDGDKISFLNKQNGIVWTYNTFAYPVLSLNNKWIIMFTGENGGYSIMDRFKNNISKFVATGELLTSYDISYSTNLLATGFINGSISLYNTQLSNLWNKSFANSEIELTKQVAISPDGKYIAAVAGLNKEHLYLINNQKKIIMDYITGEERRRPLKLTFSMNSQYLFEETDTGFNIFAVKKRRPILNQKLFQKSHDRKLISADISFDGKFIIVSYLTAEEISAVEIYTNKGTLVYRLFFESQLPFVRFAFDNYSFLIETDEKVFVYGM